jgi:ATP-binding cassette subfamily C exporter for protease/lipase
VLSVTSKLLLLRDGVAQAFGPRDQVIEALNKSNQQAAQQIQQQQVQQQAQQAQQQAMAAQTSPAVAQTTAQTVEDELTVQRSGAEVEQEQV